MTSLNRQITLASRPAGLPRVTDFQLCYTILPLPAERELLVRSVYLSLDPYMRGRMSAQPSCAHTVAIGEVMPGSAVGVVVESKDPAFSAGDTVEGMFGWQEYAIARASDARRIDPATAPISTALSVLGLPGLTAYFGLLEICKPQPGETVVISGATGGIGMLAGQIAKLKGCRVVGIASADANARWLVDELDFDAAINYANATEFGEKLGELCPAGIDVYFDNVGGEITDAVVGLINVDARVAVCGQLSLCNLETPEPGPRWLGQHVAERAHVEGFLVSTFSERFPRAREELATWLQEGRLKYREDVALGLECAPQSFIELLQGKNEGKQLVKLS